MTTYETRQGIDGDILVKIENGVESFVPMSEDNSDYQAYLTTLASSNPSTPQAGE